MATKQRLSAEDIIQHDAERTGHDFNAVHDALWSGVNSGKTRILRHKNTLAIYNILSKGVADVHFATMDQPPTIVEAFKSFYHAFKVAGFKKLNGNVDDPQVLRLLKMTKIPFHSKQSNGEYQITVEVK
jgi:hypothetical protein